MSLRLTNTLTNKTESFRSIIPNKVSIYCCGVTVYDLCHLGHARSYINWDVLRRYLIWQGYKVTFVQNFTDIDDKIIDRANKEGCSVKEISTRNINEFHTDMDSLGILRPDKMPCATNCLESIKSLIADLEKKGAAYSVDGDVYFSVKKHLNYGKLSGRDLSEQQDNPDGRVSKVEAAKKKNKFDFALWKSAKSGETRYPSQWGEGRPGWHIECSAMVKEELGDTIDIHLGGADLIFPHHENEIAQSETATGKSLANYWLHNGMVNVNGQKMSKSLGNFTTIRSLLKERISPMALRLFVLQAHYRKPLDFTDESLKAAATGWLKINNALSFGSLNLDTLQNVNLKDSQLEGERHQSDYNLTSIRKRFINAMNEDINTSGALSILFETARPISAIVNQLERKSLSTISHQEKSEIYKRWELLVELTDVLGLKFEEKNVNQKRFEEHLKGKEIESIIQSRLLAKQRKDFITADRIRSELKDIGIELIDKPNGETEWISRDH